MITNPRELADRALPNDITTLLRYVVAEQYAAHDRQKVLDYVRSIAASCTPARLASALTPDQMRLVIGEANVEPSIDDLLFGTEERPWTDTKQHGN